MVRPANQLSRQDGLPPQELRRIFRDEVLARWANYENEKPVGWLKEDWESKIDPEVLDCASEAIWRSAYTPNLNHEDRSSARTALEPVIARGLVWREFRFVRPPAIVKPDVLKDWIAWATLKQLYEHVGGDVAEVRCEHWGDEFHLIVCDSCTAVFRPKRRVSGTRYCELCRKRRAAPPLGSPETMAAFAEGKPVTISVPERVGSVVTSWKTKTLIRCPECNAIAFVRAGAKNCGKSACQSRQRRRIG